MIKIVNLFYIPPGFAHGYFLGLKKENIVMYYAQNIEIKKSESGIFWNDKNSNLKMASKKTNPISD